MSYVTFLNRVEGDVRREREAQDANACWEWDGVRDKNGYGLKTVKGRQWRVHRLAYMEATGEDPGELLVRHRCDNPPCYRPSHLLLGTHLDNMRDKVERNRCRNQYKDAEACVYGHPFTEENTYVNPASGNRQCRTCRRLSNALDKILADAPKSSRRVAKDVHRVVLLRRLEFGEEDYPAGTGGARARELRDAARAQCEAAAQRGEQQWSLILAKKVFAAIAEEDPDALRAELVRVAAVAQAWAEAIDRRSAREEAQS